MKKLILAIDQGTTGTTVLLVSETLKVIASKDIDFKQYYPKPGCVEHDLNDIWNCTVNAIKGVLKLDKSYAKKIAAIGITNQRETTCFWNKKTGVALRRAIVWQDRRTSDYCEILKEKKLEPMINEKTGLLLDPYFSASKINWAMREDSNVQKAVRKRECAFGTIDSFLVYKLTGAKTHATEFSNASRTMLLNISTLDWDSDLLDLFEIPKHVLPQLYDSDSHFGVTKGLGFLPDGIPICGVLGDQQAALLGQACIDEGAVKCTYGTGSFILMNTGNKILKSKHRLLSTVAWKIKGHSVYALEGGAFTAGASVQWLRDGLGLIKKSSDVEKLALKVDSADGVIFVPAFTGIGAPHWNAEARAAFFGITRGTTSAHIARAVLNGIAWMNHDILRAMENDLGKKMKSLNVDGGASKNNLLMQYQADVLSTQLIRPRMTETTSLGAIFVAGLGAGIWGSLSEIKKSWKKDKVFSPSLKTISKINLEKIEWDKAIRKL